MLTKTTNLTPAEKIAQIVKDSLKKWNAVEVKRLISAHYKRLRLLNKEGYWESEKLEEISDFLLPSDMDRKKVNEFIDAIAEYAQDNQYLTDFFQKAEKENFKKLSEKVKDEGEAVFPVIVSYAIALERLVKSMHDDYRILQACDKVWDRKIKEEKAAKNMNFPVWVKYKSVEGKFKDFIRYHTSKKEIPKLFFTTILSVNILEASAFDLIKGYKGNAKTGWTLAVNCKGSDTYNGKTGEGPSRWSEDKKTILLGYPFPREWSDLYATWNMAFVSHFGSYIHIVKLLIPQVNNYRHQPEAYIYNRVLALYTHIVYSAFLPAEDSIIDPTSNWVQKELTALWGDVNRKNALKYMSEIKDRVSVA